VILGQHNRFGRGRPVRISKGLDERVILDPAENLAALIAVLDMALDRHGLLVA
jgi:hypothetical protein